MKEQSVCEALETLVDKHGLLHVATALEMICDEKAAFIETNWQDKTTARVWTKAAYHLGIFVRRIEGLGI